jgi:hypothetical protein
MKYLQISIFFLFLTTFGYSQTTAGLSGSTESYGRKLVHLETGEVLQGSTVSQDNIFLKTGLFDISTQLMNYDDKIKKRETVPVLLEGERYVKKVDTVSSIAIGIATYQNNGQYILTTSGFNLHKGHWLLRNNPTTFQYGLTNSFSVGIGSIFSALLVGSFSIYLNTKYSYKVNNLLRLKVGIDALGIVNATYPAAETALLLNGGITVGLPTANFTATAYYGRLSDLGSTGFLYSIAAKIAVSQYLSIITENFIVPQATLESESQTYLSIVAARLHRQNFSLDLGYFTNRQISAFLPVFGLPFIAFSVTIN